MEMLDPLLASGVRYSTLILLAALGGLTTTWTRDLNVGLEGAMLFGAFLGVALGLSTGSVLAAAAIAVALGAVSGLVFGLTITHLRVNVFIAGFIVNILAAGGTVYLLRSLYGVKGTLADSGIPSLPTLDIPVVEGIPVLGALLSGHSVLTYVSWLLLALTAFLARRSILATHLRAAGEHPMALATAGGHVVRMRILAQVWCFALSALAGVQLSIGQLSLFTEGMTSGLGFVALAVVIFSRGRVGLLALMSFAFGVSTALSVQVDADVVPPQFAQMLPYLVALAGLIVLARTRPDAAIRIARPSLSE